MAQIRKKFGTEQEVYHRSKGQLFGGMFFLVLVIVLDVFLVRIIYVSMTDVDAIPVRKIQVEGDLSTLTKKDIEEFFPKENNEKKSYYLGSLVCFKRKYILK